MNTITDTETLTTTQQELKPIGIKLKQLAKGEIRFELSIKADTIQEAKDLMDAALEYAKPLCEN